MLLSPFLRLHRLLRLRRLLGLRRLRRRTCLRRTVGTKSTEPENSSRSSNTDYADRISCLPDDILSRILSDLDTKYVMAICVLSKRLMTFSRTLPSIILNDSLTRRSGYINYGLDFCSFGIMQIMNRNTSKIDRFKLKCYFDFSDSGIQTMLRAVTRRNVREIDLITTLSTIPSTLPFEVFKCESLEVLKLKGLAVDLTIPHLVYLPNVKVLCLEQIQLPRSDNFLTFFLGLKVLEELYLDDVFGDGDNFDLSIPSLRKFSFTSPDGYFFTLSIDTPNLVSFEFWGDIDQFRLLSKLKSLARARISFSVEENVQDEENALMIINKLHGVRSLYLSRNALEFAYPKCPFFLRTVTVLELDVCDLQMLPNILESSPQLEELVIHSYMCHSHISDFKEVEAEDRVVGAVDDYYIDLTEVERPYDMPAMVPLCLEERMRNIEFKMFTNDGWHVNLVRYLLENGKVLQSLKISVLPADWNASMEATRSKILHFPRSSKRCQVNFPRPRSSTF